MQIQVRTGKFAAPAQSCWSKADWKNITCTTPAFYAKTNPIWEIAGCLLGEATPNVFASAETANNQRDVAIINAINTCNFMEWIIPAGLGVTAGSRFPRASRAVNLESDARLVPSN